MKVRSAVNRRCWRRSGRWQTQTRDTLDWLRASLNSQHKARTFLAFQRLQRRTVQLKTVSTSVCGVFFFLTGFQWASIIYSNDAQMWKQPCAIRQYWLHLNDRRAGPQRSVSTFISPHMCNKATAKSLFFLLGIHETWTWTRAASW